MWRAKGAITKSKVDTHLFAQFHYAEPLDLSAAECLGIETWVPEGQKTPNQLLVIVREEGGGDFLANTGRSLGAPGRERSIIPLRQFQLAGWSKGKDADGEFDLKRISEIRIGWGGYFGQEGEEVQFTVAVPQAGCWILKETRN